MAIEFYSNKTDKRDARKPFYTYKGAMRPIGLATLAYVWANLSDEFFADELADVLIDDRKCLQHRSNCSNYAHWLVNNGLATVIDKRHHNTTLGKKRNVYGKAKDPECLSPELQYLAKQADSRLQLYSMLGWL